MLDALVVDSLQESHRLLADLCSGGVHRNRALRGLERRLEMPLGLVTSYPDTDQSTFSEQCMANGA